jgi:hypothetical protein
VNFIIDITQFLVSITTKCRAWTCCMNVGYVHGYERANEHYLFQCIASSLWLLVIFWRRYVQCPVLWGRVSKQATNASKTAVMDVICSVSVDSSTVQLHDSLGSRRACACSEAGFSSQNYDRAWVMYYRRTSFCCAFLRSKGLTAKDIHKEMFPVYGGKCLSRKAVHNWVANVSLMKRWKRRCGSGWDNRQKSFVLRVSTHW